MAYWGIAHAIGPNYNKVWEFFTYKEKINALKQAHEALDNGKKYYKNATDVERAMIDALAERFPTDPNIEDYSPWNDAFSECMRSVYNSFPNDLEVTAIFAESLINRTPWKLWDQKIEFQQKVRQRLKLKTSLKGPSIHFQILGNTLAYSTCTFI